MAKPADGVAHATTRTVVMASLMVLGLDFLLTALMFSFWKISMGRSKNDLWVGLFVLIGLAALVFLALQSANLLSLNFQRGYRITANYDNIGGLRKPKAAVRSAGVVVGRVADIRWHRRRASAGAD